MITSHYIFTSLFDTIFSRVCTYHLSSLSRFSHIISNALFLHCYYTFFCDNFLHSLSFLSTYSTQWWLIDFINLVFGIVCSVSLFLSCEQQSFSFNFQISFLQQFPCSLAICCFKHFSYKLFIHFFCPSTFFLFIYLSFSELVLSYNIIIF